MSNKKFLYYFVISLFVFFAVTAFFAVGLYGFGWSGPVATVVAGAVPFPAALVDGRVVTIGEVLRVRAAYDHLVSATLVGTGGVEKSRILDKLIEQEATRTVARRMKVFTSDREVDAYYDYILRKLALSGGGEKIFQTLGLSQDVFKDLVVRPDVEKNRLQVSLFEKYKDDFGYYKEANELRQSILAGSLTFDEAARAQSDDERTKYLGGEVGFIEPADLDPWTRAVAERLEAGDVSEVFAAPEGFVLIKLEAKSESEGRTLLHLKKILLKAEPAVDDIIWSQLGKSRIYRLKKI